MQFYMIFQWYERKAEVSNTSMNNEDEEMSEEYDFSQAQRGPFSL